MNWLRHIVVIMFMCAAAPLVFVEHARAGIIFDRKATEKITRDGAFKEGADLDTKFLLVGSGAETIEGGAEGELQALTLPSAGRRTGTLVDIVDRKFTVTDGPEDHLRHTLFMSGAWMGLRTLDVEGASYDLFIGYTDEVFEIVDTRMIRRAILEADNTQNGGRNQASKGANIILDKSESLRLLQGDYLLRSTVTFKAISYERAGWMLKLRDERFGSQGIGSGEDMQGFQSRLTPREVLPPPNPIPEPSTIWLVSLVGFWLLSSSRRGQLGGFIA